MLAVSLKQAGAFVHRTGWSYAQYLERLRARPLALHAEDLAGIGTTAARVWESPLEQVVRSGRCLAPGSPLGCCRASPSRTSQGATRS